MYERNAQKQTPSRWFERSCPISYDDRSTRVMTFSFIQIRPYSAILKGGDMVPQKQKATGSEACIPRYIIGWMLSILRLLHLDSSALKIIPFDLRHK